MYLGCIRYTCMYAIAMCKCVPESSVWVGCTCPCDGMRRLEEAAGAPALLLTPLGQGFSLYPELTDFQSGWLS